MTSGTPLVAPPRADGAWRRGFDACRALGRRIGFAPPLLLLAFAMPTSRGEHIAGIPSLCALHRFTGLPCPGCGITRSVVCAAHGLWADSLALHPLGIPVLLVLIGLTALRVLRRRVLVPRPTADAATWIAIASLAGIWLARLAGVLPSPP